MRKLLFIAIIIALTACKKENPYFSGYVDTDLVYLSADFGGRLTELVVQKGMLVKKNQFLFKLEQTNERYQVEMSQFNDKNLLTEKQQALIQLNYNELNYKRIRAMRQHNAASQNDLDAALRDLKISKQQLADINIKIKNNQLEIDDKKWQLTRKENFAPDKGIIFDTYYTLGEFVQPGYPVLSLITQNNIKAVFFVPEEKLSQLKLNAPIKILTDHQEHYAKGHIFYIANIAEYTPPIIYSKEERQRLVFRIEAKIDTPDLQKIHLGQPVTLELM